MGSADNTRVGSSGDCPIGDAGTVEDRCAIRTPVSYQRLQGGQTGRRTGTQTRLQGILSYAARVGGRWQLTGWLGLDATTMSSMKPGGYIQPPCSSPCTFHRAYLVATA